MTLPTSELTKVVKRWQRIADDIFQGRADEVERHVRRMLEYMTGYIRTTFPEAATETVHWGALYEARTGA